MCIILHLKLMFQINVFQKIIEVFKAGTGTDQLFIMM